MRDKAPVGIIVCCLVIFVASFLPWGSIRLVPTPGSVGEPFKEMLNSMDMSVTLTGWRGHLTLIGVTLPNWLAVFSGFAIFIVTLLSFGAVWPAPAGALITLSVYGVVHAGFMVLIMVTQATVGIGSLLTLACFLALLVLTIKGAGGKASHVYSSTSSGNEGEDRPSFDRDLSAPARPRVQDQHPIGLADPSQRADPSQHVDPFRERLQKRTPAD